MLPSSVLGLCLAVLCALAVDFWAGEPPLRYHPVVWMGHYLKRAGNWVQGHSRQTTGATGQGAEALGGAALRAHATVDALAFLCGLGAWLLGGLVVVTVAAGVQYFLQQLPWWATAVAVGLVLKPLLAWAMLKTEVRAVESALAQSLDAGRERLRWLVSRDVTVLSETQVRESAIETLAENLNDSVVAPIFWFVLLGLPGAALYRFANTADAMWGYPGAYNGGNWAWAGKWAARVDDGLSWVPARMTALCLLLAAGLQGLRLVRQLPQEAARTPSPNSGWPMAAMALALNVGLRKPGVYVLNAQGGKVRAADTVQAIWLGNLALLLFVVLACPALVAVDQGVSAWGTLAGLLTDARVLP